MTKKDKRVMGIKHLIECHCVLKVYDAGEEIFHKFPVYSKFDKDGKIISKIVKCNNCDALHKIVEICKSEIIAGGDESNMTIDLDDLACMLDDRLVNILNKYKCDISIWEHVCDIIENEIWDEHVVLKREIIQEEQHLKVLKILSENKFKILSKKINDTLTLK